MAVDAAIREGSGVKILLVNSNTTEAVTDLIRQEALGCIGPGVEIVCVTARFGASAIESRWQAAIAAHATLEAFVLHSAGVDAGIIACFSDPGLAAVRQLMRFPVVGLAEAAMHTACMIGGRFSIVAVGSQFETSIREQAILAGLASRLASVRAIDRDVLGAADDASGTLRDLAGLVERAVSEDGAEVVILGGAVTAGMARQLNQTSPVLVLDGVACAVRQAIALAGLAVTKPRTGSYRRQKGLSRVGLSADLSAEIGRLTDE